MAEEQNTDMEKQLIDAMQQAGEYKAMAQRIQAEFENYKKRVDKEKVDAKEFAKIETIKKILPLLDSLETALLATFSSSTNMETLKKDYITYRKGVELLYAQFHAMLKSEGVSQIKALKEKFDPNLHDALLVETREDVPDDSVVEELQKGYKLGNYVLRHSKVKIATHDKQQNPS